MSKKICIVFLFIMCVYIFVSCGGPSSQVVKVIMTNSKTAKSTDLPDKEYYVVYTNNKSKKTEPFDGDHAKIYTAAPFCFSSYNENNKVKNSLNTVSLKDANGKIVENDDTITTIMQKAAEQIEDDILKLQIIRDDNEYFVFIKLNVNLQSPCYLYKYNMDKKTLEMLYKWDGVDIVDLSIR